MYFRLHVILASPSEKANRRQRPNSKVPLWLLVAVGSCAQWTGAGVEAFNAPTTTPSTTNFACDALRSLLHASNTAAGNCSVVVLGDHTTTATALLQGASSGYAEGGTMLLQLPVALTSAKLNANTTTALERIVDDFVKMARQLRMETSCLSVVIATDAADVLAVLLQRATQGHLMLWKTHGIIATSLPSALAVVEGKWLFTMMNTHLLLLPGSEHKDRARVYRHEPYSPEGSRTRLVGVYTTSHDLTLTQPLMHEKFDNFYGAAINFRTLTYLPFIGVSEELKLNGTKIFVFSGTEYEIFLTFAKALNFTPTYIEPENWDQVDQELADRNSFIIPCIYLMSPWRLKEFDFVYPYLIDDVAFSMRVPRLLSNWDNFLKPFTVYVWLCTVCVIVIIAMALILVLRLSVTDTVACRQSYGSRQLMNSENGISITRAILEVFGTLLGQVFTFKMPQTNSFRVLLTAFLIFIMVISTGYKSKLFSLLALPKIPARPETVAQLVESNAMITTPPWGAIQQQQMATSSNTDHQALSSRFIIVPSIEDGLQAALTNGTAHLEGRLFQSYAIAENFMSPDGSTDIYIGRQGVLSAIGSMPIPFSAPYKQQLDALILAIVQAGLYRKWNDNEMENLRISKVEEARKAAGGVPQSPTDDTTSGVKAITLAQLQGPFWILICGSALTVVCFLLELLKWKITNVSQLTY